MRTAEGRRCAALAAAPVRSGGQTPPPHHFWKLVMSSQFAAAVRRALGSEMVVMSPSGPNRPSGPHDQRMNGAALIGCSPVAVSRTPLAVPDVAGVFTTPIATCMYASALYGSAGLPESAVAV